MEEPCSLITPPQWCSFNTRSLFEWVKLCKQSTNSSNLLMSMELPSKNTMPTIPLSATLILFIPSKTMIKPSNSRELVPITKMVWWNTPSKPLALGPTPCCFVLRFIGPNNNISTFGPMPLSMPFSYGITYQATLVVLHLWSFSPASPLTPLHTYTEAMFGGAPLMSWIPNFKMARSCPNGKLVLDEANTLAFPLTIPAPLAVSLISVLALLAPNIMLSTMTYFLQSPMLNLVAHSSLNSMAPFGAS